ncbi:MAG: C1 family peptidase [Lactobacillales bacterium]|jgi:hypothetical protein|nr:C1 family peptidase [Lactobacillales bacterium]
MKKSIKIAATVILASATVLSSLPTQALASGFQDHSKFATWKPIGLDQGTKAKNVNENQPYKKAVVKEHKFDIKGRIHESNKSKKWNPVQLPEKIDPRGTALETPVRDQGNQGLCWAYSATDVLAINQIKQTGHREEYSPNYLNYVAGSNLVTDGWDDFDDDAASSNPTASWWYGGYSVLGDGGDPTITADNLQLHQVGLVKEKTFPSYEYVERDGETYGTTRLATTRHESLDTIKLLHASGDTINDVKNVEIVSGISDITSENVAKHTQEVKTLVSQYGAASLYINALFLFPNFTAHTKAGNVYNNEHNALNIPYDYAANKNNRIKILYRGEIYNTGIMGVNHIVSIVGYDDNYSKDNFNEAVRPANDGAFLVKNSWGTGVHDNGYFWLSYESTMANAHDITAFQVGKHEDHKVLQNTKSAAAADIAGSEFDEYNGKSYIAETFDASDVDRTVTNVNVPFGAENIKYDVSIIEGDLNVGGTNANQASELDHKTSYHAFKPKTLKTVTGAGKFAGENKIPFDFKLKAGHKYTVIVEETAAPGTDIDYLTAANPYVPVDQLPGHSYFGVINGNNVYSLDYKTSSYFETPDYENVGMQNNLTLDIK